MNRSASEKTPAEESATAALFEKKTSLESGEIFDQQADVLVARSDFERYLIESGVFPTRGEFKVADIESMTLEELQWRSSFVKDCLAADLLPPKYEMTIDERKKFIFMKPDERKEWEKKLKNTQPKETATRTATDTSTNQHRARVRERKSYLSPAREDTVIIAAHAAPELKEALKKKFEQSGFEHFNDFLVASLHRIAQEPPVELKPTTELAETALAQSRELQKTISRLTQDLSTRPGRSR